MALKFREKNALGKIAELLYNFLPGSGSLTWKSHVNYGTVAKSLGLQNYWIGGNKLNSITYLLENTYEKERKTFQTLIETIVIKSIAYRNKRNNPLTRKEVESLNDYLFELGVKFPSLYNEEFLNSLFIPDNELTLTPEISQKQPDIENKLLLLKNRFSDLLGQNNRQQAGLALEQILNKIFDIYDLAPREPFKIIGEQIDGSIEFKDEIYLIEAKWTASKVNEGELLKFAGIISGKSSFTRGIFISINGYTEECLHQIKQGKQPSFFLMDGYDIWHILEAQYSLPDLLGYKLRKLCEEGEMLAYYKLEIKD